jgi:hypothetical protein
MDRPRAEVHVVKWRILTSRQPRAAHFLRMPLLKQRCVIPILQRSIYIATIYIDMIQACPVESVGVGRMRHDGRWI